MSAAFLDELRRLALLEPEQLDEVERSLHARFPEPKALAQELLQRDWLTAYQANLLLQGRGSELVLGSYVLLDKLGEGGMGAVFKARHRMLGRIVALKLVRKDRLANEAAVKRFRREIQAAAQLNHPNIVLAFDADQAGDVHFFTMEYVAGTDLAQLVKEKGPLPVDQACAYIRQAAVGLQHAFAVGLVHRDIKPHNLLLAQGVVKILDMGLARVARPGAADEASSTLTKEGSVMGSLDYISPEQAMDSHTVDIRADLYSLGCTFYHLLTGRVPFPGGEALAKLLKHQQQEPEPIEKLRAEVPAGVVAVVRKLMAKKPEDRYQTPADLVTALERLASGKVEPRASTGAETQSTGQRRDKAADPANTLAYEPRKRQQAQRRSLLLLGASVGALALFAAVLGYAVYTGRPGPKLGPVEKPTAGVPAGELPREFTNALGMKFVLVPKGKSWLGGGNGKPGAKEVDITEDYYLGAYEVTQGEWEKVMGTNPSYFKGVAGVAPDELQRFPVEMVSWEDCQLFIKKLNEHANEAGWAYRLPTAVEWEYACRGGPMQDKAESIFDYYLGTPSNTLLPAQANFKDSDLNRTCKVGSYAPNRLGLYDMHGNVWEWCQDKDSKGAALGLNRGGGYSHDRAWCLAAYRNSSPPSNRYYNHGLRLARVPVSDPSLTSKPLTSDESAAKQLQADWAVKLMLPVEATNKLGMKLILIPPGPGVVHAYYLGKYEVTQGEWEQVMGSNPSGFGPKRPKVAGMDTSRFPVETVSWFDSVEFCNKLSEREGLKPYYDLTVKKRAGSAIDDADVKVLGGNGYHIPTDAEWTHGCAAGAKTKYHFGDSDEELLEYAWFDQNSDGRTHAVGEKKPNGFGLYDMHGNVREWNEEMLTNATTGAPERVFRGGAWNTPAGHCAVSYRYRHVPANRHNNFGLRLARVPAGQAAAKPPEPEIKTPEPKPFAPLPGKEYVTNSVGMHLVKIPKGKFTMGAPQVEAGSADDERPQHEVEITQDFYLGVYEVTQEQYQAVMATNPSSFKGAGLPVDSVNWNDADAFCQKLSALDLERAAKRTYRLPTEAEWEYACRAGAQTPFNIQGTDGQSLSSEFANFNGEAPYSGAPPKGIWRNKTTPVGTFPPNASGLYDLHGNVWEWCADWYGPYQSDVQQDPRGPPTGARHVLRGGSWNGVGVHCRAARRYNVKPGDRYNDWGFRVVAAPMRTP